jgi:glutamine cyclotransferase
MDLSNQHRFLSFQSLEDRADAYYKSKQGIDLPADHCLNGIAYDESTKQLLDIICSSNIISVFLTGKKWPYITEISLDDDLLA